MGHAISFFAAGEPKGQPRPRAVMRGNRAGMFDPGTADGFKAAVKLASREVGIAGARIARPVALTVTLYFPRPAHHHRAGDKSRELKPTAPKRHTGKPDADNCAKAVMDALNDFQVWGDDSQVCDLRAAKFYADDSGRVGVEITITEIED